MPSKRKNAHAVALGRKGGLSRSPKKVAAGQRNILKAVRARVKAALDRKQALVIEFRGK